jgi:hypothetical protein
LRLENGGDRSGVEARLRSDLADDRVLVDASALPEESAAKGQVEHPHLLGVLAVGTLIGLERRKRRPQVLLVGPALAPAKGLLDGDEGPLLIDDVAEGGAVVDMLEWKGAPA